MKTTHIIMLCFSIVLLDTTAFTLVNPWLTQSFLSYFHYDYTASELTNLSYNLLFTSAITFLLSPAYFLLSPIAGFLSDRWGRKTILISLYCCICIAFIILLLAAKFENQRLMLFGGFFLGIEPAAMAILLATTLDVSRGQRRALALGAMFLAASISMSIVLQLLKYSLGNQLLNTSIATNLVIIGLGLEIVSLLLVIFLLPETVNHSYQTTDDKATIIDSLFVNNKLRFLLILFFILNFCWGLLHQAIFPHLTLQQHFTTTNATHLLQVIILTMLISICLLYPLIAKIMSIKKALMLSLALIASSMIVIGSSNNQTLIVFSNILFAVGITLAIPFNNVLLANVGSQEHYGLLMGGANFMWALSWLLSSNVDTALGSFFTWREITVFSAAILLLMLIFMSRHFVIKRILLKN